MRYSKNIIKFAAAIILLIIIPLVPLTVSKIQDDKLRPPLNSIAGFGTVAAQGIVNARKDRKIYVYRWPKNKG